MIQLKQKDTHYLNKTDSKNVILLSNLNGINFDILNFIIYRRKNDKKSL